MNNILLARIDNRLVHGQVGTAWARYIDANLIIVADDLVIKDDTQMAMMKLLAQTVGIGIRFFSLDETLQKIPLAAPSQKIFLITRTPKEMCYLIENGLQINEVNIGNMHASDNKKQITGNVFVSEDDIHDIIQITSRGVKVYSQSTPSSPNEEIKFSK